MDGWMDGYFCSGAPDPRRALSQIHFIILNLSPVSQCESGRCDSCPGQSEEVSGVGWGGMWGTAGRRGERRDRGAEVVFVWRACTESSLCFNTAGNQRLVFTEQTVFIIIIIIIVITRIFSALTASSNVLLPMDFSWKQCSVLLLLLFAVEGKTPRGVGQRGTRKKHAQYFTLNMPLSD